MLYYTINNIVFKIAGNIQETNETKVLELWYSYMCKRYKFTLYNYVNL